MAQKTQKTIYMAITKEDGLPWHVRPQIVLPGITWKQAVKIAKSQNGATRLSESEGYNNQGHYFQPENL